MKLRKYNDFNYLEGLEPIVRIKITKMNGKLLEKVDNDSSTTQRISKTRVKLRQTSKKQTTTKMKETSL